MEQRKTPRVSGVKGRPTRCTAINSVIVERDEAPENRGLSTRGVAEANNLGGVDRGGLWGWGLKGIGRHGDSATEQGGFFTAARGGASGTTSEERQHDREDKREGKLSFHQRCWGKSIGFKGGYRTKKGGLPRQKHFIQCGRSVGQLGELGAIGNKRGVNS